MLALVTSRRPISQCLRIQSDNQISDMLSDKLSALHDAINCASLVRLRETLVVLSIQSDVIRNALSSRLLVSEGDLVQPTGASAEPAMQASSKKRPRYEQCKHCKSEFDVMKNREGSCVYHDGELQPPFNPSFGRSQT